MNIASHICSPHADPTNTTVYRPNVSPSSTPHDALEDVRGFLSFFARASASGAGEADRPAPESLEVSEPDSPGSWQKKPGSQSILESQKPAKPGFEPRSPDSTPTSWAKSCVVTSLEKASLRETSACGKPRWSVVSEGVSWGVGRPPTNKGGRTV